jgi:heme/copper-type cytochrome/quinol oxidase subunit 2
MLAVLALATPTAPRSAPAMAQDAGVQVIEVSAKKYDYTPSAIRVKSGSKVQLKITATDRDHGFKMSAIPDGGTSADAAGLVFTTTHDCWELKKGEPTVIEFVAKTPGVYSFKCCHRCGLGHGGMKGQLIVE